MTRRALVLVAWGAALGAVCTCTGCHLGPAYQPPRPPTPVAGSFKEAPTTSSTADGSVWTIAGPEDALPRGKWWTIFNDPELNSLEDRLDINNQNLKQYFENFMEARALIAEARAGLYPLVTAGASATRSGGSRGGSNGSSGSSSSGSSYSIPIDISWEPDLWGSIHDKIRAAEYGAQVSAADLENEKLSEEAALAEYFFEIRGQDALQKLLDQTVSNDRNALQLTQVLYQTGIADQSAVLLAQTALDSAIAEATGVGTARAQYEHAIAVLVGTIATDFSIPVRAAVYQPPSIPVGLPSQLVQRRPDVAGAERTMAEANETIDVGYGAFFPQLTLSADVGLASSALKKIFNAASRFWSVGPSLSQTLYDGGLYRAELHQYTAIYNADVANYRQTVLVAFQQVEDYLAAVRIDSSEIQQQQTTVTSAQAALKLENARFKNGLDPYLDVLTAQNTLVAAQQTLLNLQVQDMTSAAQLVQALGGGWDQSQLPSPGATAAKPGANDYQIIH